MDAELIAVGSELLQTGFTDTNSPWLVARLGRIGVVVRQVAVVGDAEPRIATAVAGALERAEVVILTGGLGPTEDDRTRAGLARALGVPLERDPERAAGIERRLGTKGHPANPDQFRQAERPRGARFLDNPVGIAPGLAAASRGSLLFALPGVPAEMRAMFELSVEPVLLARSRGVLRRRVLKVAGRTESSVDRLLRDLYTAPHVEVTILARPSGVELVLQAEGATPDEARALLERLDEAMSRRLGEDLFGRDDETLAAVVGAALLRRRHTLSTAESGTAGLLAAVVTEVPGSSSWFRGGLVLYADDLKTALGGVDARTIEQHGAVSAEVAREMARGVRERCRADHGLAITGIAGPSGGTEDKPVGLVHVGLADRDGEGDFRFLLPGDRDLVRRRAVTLALDQMRRRLLGLP